MVASRKLILNRLRSITDEPGPIVDFFHGFRMARASTTGWPR
jgi:hypothetical protein